MTQFREAIIDDYEDICNLIESEEELFLVHPNGKYPLNRKQLIELAKVRLELSVLNIDEKIIGFANLYHFEPDKFVFIGNIIIDKCYRKKGMGKRLVLNMINVAFKKYKLPQVNISVFNENTKALLLYTGLGFTVYDIEERKNINGERVALLHLRKLNHE